MRIRRVGANADGQTHIHMTKLIVALLNFTNTPKRKNHHQFVRVVISWQYYQTPYASFILRLCTNTLSIYDLPSV